MQMCSCEEQSSSWGGRQGLSPGLSIWPWASGSPRGLWTEPGAPQRADQKPQSQPQNFLLEMGKLKSGGRGLVVELGVVLGLLNICLMVQGSVNMHHTPGETISGVQAALR